MNRIQLYLSHPHDCSYLEARLARTLFLDPQAALDNALYAELISQGFRRSGGMIYRPACDGCGQCLSSRIPVTLFQPRRSQRRVLEKWLEVETVVHPASFAEEQFALYNKYVDARHPEGGMTGVSEVRYMEFLSSQWSETLFVEFRLAGRLIAVAVTDLLPAGLSAVYTYFDPEYGKMSPGVFAILWQIEETNRRRLPHLYLGYLVPDCLKMRYKAEYRPLEIYSPQQERWLPWAASPPSRAIDGSAEAGATPADRVRSWPISN
ncbi:MAG: arginyltransferase [Gammaproteobacteria bacterium]|nr:arginyltransferase [Gammaproteobacteria bacterium]